jgi:hypothetical protein
MEVLKRTHGVEKEQERLDLRVVPSDTIEKDVVRTWEGSFKGRIQWHLTERIRQAARRLVGIPGRGGDKWQVIALEEAPDEKSEDGKTWVRRVYAPARGQIMLGLVRAGETLGTDIKEPTPEEAGLENDSDDNNTKERKINGIVLKEPPEWGGRWWLDDAGKVHQATDTKRPQRDRTVWQQDTAGTSTLLGGKWADNQRTKLRRHPKKATGWSNLLSENKKTIDTLASERIKQLRL